jgi:hypothetical protein
LDYIEFPAGPDVPSDQVDCIFDTFSGKDFSEQHQSGIGKNHSRAE